MYVLHNMELKQYQDQKYNVCTTNTISGPEIQCTYYIIWNRNNIRTRNIMYVLHNMELKQYQDQKYNVRIT